MAKRHFIIMKSFLVALLVCTCLPLISSAETSNIFDSYGVAVYNEILNGSNSDIDLFHTAMSSDGSALYFTGMEGSTGDMVAGYINSDGSGMKTYDASDYSAHGLVVNGDGSRAFFISETIICKIEDSGISKVVDIDLFYPYALDTTDAGDHVYCTLSGRKGILKFSYEGLDTEVAVQGNDIEMDGNAISSIHDFAVSDDGENIAFLVDGYVSDEIEYAKPEVFSMVNGDYKQLTSDGVANDGTFRMVHDISGDGDKILYTDNDRYFIVSSTNSDSKELGEYDGWGKLNDSGKMMFVSNSGQGILVDTESNQELVLFPRDGVNIAGDVGNTFISGDGKTISFTVMDAQGKTSLYVGHFYSDVDEIAQDVSSDSVVYSDDEQEAEKSGSVSGDDGDGVSKSAELVVSTENGDDGISNDIGDSSSTGDEKTTVADSDEKSAGYTLATPFLVSVLGLCAMIVSRKDRR